MINNYCEGKKICLTRKRMEPENKKKPEVRQNQRLTQYFQTENKTGSAMHENNMRLTNRRVIFLALSVWFITQALLYLEPFGAPGFLSSSLTITGFVALPALVIWPLIRKYVGRNGLQRPSALKLPAGEKRNQALICAEIAALSAMLIYLMSQRPQ